jgi:hypothetical protein
MWKSLRYVDLLYRDTLKGREPQRSHFVTFYKEKILWVLEDKGKNKVGFICEKL